MTKKLTLGIDVGGTKVEGALAFIDTENHSFEVLSKNRISLPGHNAHSFTEQLAVFIHDLVKVARIEGQEILSIGLGLPGSIDPKTKRMVNGNTHFLIGENISELLSEKLQWNTPVFVENDANLFTLAESWGGVGLDYFQNNSIPFDEQVALGITLGTGVGGGLVYRGKIYSGANGGSLEVGHVCLDPQGRHCYCGQLGCSESYLSGTALQKNRYDWSAHEIFEKYRNEDINAEKILKDYREKFLHLLKILSNLFNPHYFVFGGGLSNQQDLFTDLQKELGSQIFLGEKYSPTILMNKLGDSAALYGAMIHSLRELHL
jgi:predicted NBD/HSP70 family sugar kinase